MQMKNNLLNFQRQIQKVKGSTITEFYRYVLKQNLSSDVRKKVRTLHTKDLIPLISCYYSSFIRKFSVDEDFYDLAHYSAFNRIYTKNRNLLFERE